MGLFVNMSPLTSLAADSVLNQAAGDLHMHVQMVGLCLAAVAR